jgi:hypothetical protein
MPGGGLNVISTWILCGLVEALALRVHHGLRGF